MKFIILQQNPNFPQPQIIEEVEIKEGDFSAGDKMNKKYGKCQIVEFKLQFKEGVHVDETYDLDELDLDKIISTTLTIK